MKIIDGHAHACGMFLHTNEVLSYMKENHIYKIILTAGEPNSKKIYKLPYLAKVFHDSKLIYITNILTAILIRFSKLNKHIDQGNEKVALMAQNFPDYIMNTYWINPLEADCIQKIESFRKKYSFCMIKMHQCWTKFDMKDERIIKVIEWAELHRKPIFIHLKSKIQVKKFISLTKKYPSVKFILAHLIGVEEFDRTVGENVYFDISCPSLHSVKMLKRAWDNFGAERILLGSDAPYGTHNINLAISQMREIGMNDEEIELVCSKNIQKLLGIN
ncbi:amidohydrolase family protein [Lacrimispora saccharolytica]|uniref:Amidohydrolase 2 n=1 Tax=Lacrimispora saccharolytica (strain ATCC 35040 / DSM 2544 / NRCC 2533 / WM1) TaxID=610130 RepID=D9R5R3_LACSW|nr:TatD family hydrolase [Lacrimispora saccharolytica]ADL05246.1 amidohydrolase 2 [[Clostridium] saccharolyticum WM1]QRV20578.1 amidohydrolase family protein [Lacrimispora saccharolytica]